MVEGKVYPSCFLLSILPCHCRVPSCLPSSSSHTKCTVWRPKLGVGFYSCAASPALAGWFDACQVVELMSYLLLPQKNLVLYGFKNHRAVKVGKDL